MDADHNVDPLDWATYNALVKVIVQMRQEFIDEREKESTESQRKHEFLLLQMAMTEVRSRMLDRMTEDLDRNLKRKDS